MTFSEENYLKTIYHLSPSNSSEVSTNAIADSMETKPSSVTDMLKKLAEKSLINYVKYQGVSLTEKGNLAAKMIVRKHRLWEVFLFEKLEFNWDEVHEIAEQLEHIKSDKLINKLDKFLNFPTEDPHGDPIPNANGQISKIDKKLLAELKQSQSGICVGVIDSSPTFLQYLDNKGISLGSKIEVISIEAFDLSYRLIINRTEMVVSSKITNKLLLIQLNY